MGTKAAYPELSAKSKRKWAGLGSVGWLVVVGLANLAMPYKVRLPSYAAAVLSWAREKLDRQEWTWIPEIPANAPLRAALMRFAETTAIDLFERDMQCSVTLRPLQSATRLPLERIEAALNLWWVTTWHSFDYPDAVVVVPRSRAVDYRAAEDLRDGGLIIAAAGQLDGEDALFFSVLVTPHTGELGGTGGAK